MNKPISRRKLLFLAGMATSIVMPATMLIASNAEAQQADQTPSPGQTAPKKKKRREDRPAQAPPGTPTKQPKAQ